jgi:uncharacterized membrane protein YjjP (DUF1212 family)
MCNSLKSLSHGRPAVLMAALASAVLLMLLQSLVSTMLIAGFDLQLAY